MYEETCCLVSPFSVSHFSRPVIEANLHRKPVIASDVKGMDEIVKHQVNGLIVAKNNPIELAKAINYMAENPLKAKEFGENGYNLVKDVFSPKNIYQFEKVYDSLIKVD